MEEIASLISVIIPNYNHEIYLVQRLESVFNQTIQDFEVILLDDCSTDDSLEILKKYSNNPKVSHCVFNEINSGNTFVQWNKGIALAKGEYIWIAESDDFCEVNFLEEVLKPLLADKEVVLSYCQSNKVNGANVIAGTWLEHTMVLDSELFKASFISDGDEYIERFLIYKNVIPNASAVLFKKARFVEIGGVDKDKALKYNGDWTFYIRMISNSKIGFIADSLNSFRYHDKSVIATAGRTENTIALLNILLETRKKIRSIIKSEPSMNELVLLKLNRSETNKINDQRANYFIKNNQTLKGYLLKLRNLKFLLIKKELM
jgi:glycosyltransferase involved in cell wall biosynthesis